jgi:hypothetical protein
MVIEIVTLFDEYFNSMTNISSKNSTKNLNRYIIRTLTYFIRSRDRDSHRELKLDLIYLNIITLVIVVVNLYRFSIYTLK